MIEKEEIIEENTEEVDLFNSWRSLEFNIDEDYDYVPNNLSFRLLSDTLYFLIAYPILKILTKIIYDLKIEGEENIRYLENGAVTISNHVLVLDCAMIGLACGFRKEHFTTLAKSFKIPVVRRLIKLLKAIPIPEEISNKKNFFRAIDKLLLYCNIGLKNVLFNTPQSALYNHAKHAGTGGKGQNIIKEQPVFRLTAFRSFTRANNSPAACPKVFITARAEDP